MALLFDVFGIHLLSTYNDDDSEEVVERPGHDIFFTTFSLILVAEFDDKTQAALAGLASTTAPFLVWLGATTALALVSALGVWAGRTILQRLPLRWLHRLGGRIFPSVFVTNGLARTGLNPAQNVAILLAIVEFESGTREHMLVLRCPVRPV